MDPVQFTINCSSKIIFGVIPCYFCRAPKTYPLIFDFFLDKVRGGGLLTDASFRLNLPCRVRKGVKIAPHKG